ncbi:dienelactone hydrolase family protein [Daejeonella oryzae]|uniref:dienelactone hydrolase family protein n=1 Tax=Daejeonella oryzae TaxID=1122943 RepID=UPI000429256B|nr:dienelactone hydrolase family protein [Daejeonella oryzae]
MEMLLHKTVSIYLDDILLKGELCIPAKAQAIIIFSHGSGSSRLSVRNQMVATYLQQKQFGTLLFDLLTEEEDQDYSNRFDIDLLSSRLIGATQWLLKVPAAKDCRLGFFGASTGAASALQAAAQLPEIIAVVSRGGRPDLASKSDLHSVNAATLLIVGSLDKEVLNLNKEAFSQLKCEKRLEIVEGASHLFEEPGKMEIVSELAASWFEKYSVRVNV